MKGSLRWLVVLALAAPACGRSEALQPREIDAGQSDAGASDAGHQANVDAGCFENAPFDAGHECDIANPCGRNQGCDPVLIPCSCASGRSLQIGTRCVDVNDVVGSFPCQNDGDCGPHWVCQSGTCAPSICDEAGCDPGCFSTSETHVTCSPCICASCDAASGG